MGTYMIVRLKNKYKDDTQVDLINEALHKKYGASKAMHFVTWASVIEEANYYNTNIKGKTMLPHYTRPISAETLAEDFFWYEPGAFHAKISSVESLEDALNIVAVSKWIIDTNGMYINKTKSSNYSKTKLQCYLDELLASRFIRVEYAWKL